VVVGVHTCLYTVVVYRCSSAILLLLLPSYFYYCCRRYFYGCRCYITKLYFIIIIIIYYCPRGDHLYSMDENATIVPPIHTTVRAQRWKNRCYYNTHYHIIHHEECVSVWTHYYNVADFANTLLYYYINTDADLLETVFQNIIVIIILFPGIDVLTNV